MRWLTIPLSSRRIHGCFGLVSFGRVSAPVDVLLASFKGSAGRIGIVSEDLVAGVVAQVIVHDLGARLVARHLSGAGRQSVVVTDGMCRDGTGKEKLGDRRSRSRKIYMWVLATEPGSEGKSSRMLASGSQARDGVDDVNGLLIASSSEEAILTSEAEGRSTKICYYAVEIARMTPNTLAVELDSMMMLPGTTKK